MSHGLNKFSARITQPRSQGASQATYDAVAAASERDAWQLFDEFNARNASVGFAELEWE